MMSDIEWSPPDKGADPGPSRVDVHGADALPVDVAVPADLDVAVPADLDVAVPADLDVAAADPGDMAAMAALAGSGAAVRAGRNRHRVARRILTLLIVVMLVVEAILLEPHLARTGTALTHLHWGWVGVAVLGEFASMLYFARLQRRMLRAGGVRVRLGVALATAMAANALSVTLPAGPVVSTGYTFQRMRSWGASGPLATWGMIASGALSTVALAVIGIFGSGLAGGHKPDPIVVAIEILVAVVAVFFLRRLVHDPERLMHLGEYSLTRVNRLMHKPPQRGQDRVHQVVDELLLIRPRPRDWFLGLNFAILNWVADLVCLLAACRSVGAHGPTVAVGLVAYAAGMAASSISLLPGGLGVVDGTLVLALTRGGLPAALATAAVVVYRLISFVLVAAIGWLAWVILRRIDRRYAAAATVLR